MIQSYKAPDLLLDELGITDPSEIDIEVLAQRCGATIVYEPLDGCAARILGAGDRAIVTVDANAPRGRQRFSAAHELGHWMRDRGKIAFSCSDYALLQEWGDDNPERRANRYAADLLLPRKILNAHARGLPVTFSSARLLAKMFETSLTATAIRLVELGSAPALIVSSGPNGRKWFFRSPLLPSVLWPTKTPGPGAVATRLLAGTATNAGSATVDADDWIDHADASRYSVHEDSMIVGNGLVLSLIWWQDERQILDLQAAEDEEEDAEDK